MTPNGFWCRCCGEWHEELPLAYWLPVPERILGTLEERKGRVYLDDELCAVKESEIFLVRGRLEIPVIDGPETFAYTVWISLSEANFQRTIDLWQTAGRESEPPYFG